MTKLLPVEGPASRGPAPQTSNQGPWTLWLLILPLVKLVVHLATLSGYGWFRDELYYLACARHLDWGYVDHPAFSIVALRTWISLFGDSREVARVLPALTGAAVVLVVGLLARRFGGGAKAQAVAMLAVLTAPVFLGTAHIVSMNGFDMLFWAVAALCLATLLASDSRTATRHSWLGLGLVLTLGLANKISLLWFGAGLAVALLITPARRLLATPWPWLVGITSVLLGLGPYVWWNASHGWPTREFIENASGSKMAAVSIGTFLGKQVEMLDPLSAPLWIVGLVWLWFGARGRWRPLAVIYLVVATLLVANGTSRSGYLAPAYTWLFAAGGVAFESGLRRLGEWARVRGGAARRVLGPALLGTFALALVAGGILLAPFALPVLPVERFLAYQSALGVEPGTAERKTVGPLNQHYADMFGWDVIAATYARAYHSLTPAEQAHTALYAQDYGVAGAIDQLGRPLGLPGALSGHNNYFLWGAERQLQSIELVIVQDDDPESLARQFEDVQLFAPLDCGLCMPYERETSLYICRRPRLPIEQMWPRVRNYS